MTAYAFLFTVAAVGIIETIYLIKTRMRSEKPACPIGEQCAVVLASRFSKIFLFPNDVWGLLFYIVSALMVAFLMIGFEPAALWHMVLKIAIVTGSLFSIFLTYLQWRVIKAWCFWCVMSAFTVWLMGGIILISNLL